MEPCDICGHLNARLAHTCVNCNYPIREVKERRASNRAAIRQLILFTVIGLFIIIASHFGWITLFIKHVLEPIITNMFKKG